MNFQVVVVVVADVVTPSDRQFEKSASLGIFLLSTSGDSDLNSSNCLINYFPCHEQMAVIVVEIVSTPTVFGTRRLKWRRQGRRRRRRRRRRQTSRGGWLTRVSA